MPYSRIRHGGTWEYLLVKTFWDSNGKLWRETNFLLSCSHCFFRNGLWHLFPQALSQGGLAGPGHWVVRDPADKRGGWVQVKAQAGALTPFYLYKDACYRPRRTQRWEMDTGVGCRQEIGQRVSLMLTNKERTVKFGNHMFIWEHPSTCFLQIKPISENHRIHWLGWESQGSLSPSIDACLPLTPFQTVY